MTKPSVVAMLRLDHAGALGHAGDAHRAALQRHFAEGDLGDQVRGHDGARDVVEARPSPGPSTSAGSALVIRAASSSTPMTPVEDGSTWSAGSFSALRGRAAAWPAPRASPVRVAQLALPALTRTAPAAPREACRWRAAQPHRRGLHAVRGEDRGGGGRRVRRRSAPGRRLGCLADAGVHGGVTVTERQFHFVTLLVFHSRSSAGR